MAAQGDPEAKEHLRIEKIRKGDWKTADTIISLANLPENFEKDREKLLRLSEKYECSQIRNIQHWLRYNLFIEAILFESPVGGYFYWFGYIKTDDNRNPTGRGWQYHMLEPHIIDDLISLNDEHLAMYIWDIHQ